MSQHTIASIFLFMFVAVLVHTEIHALYQGVLYGVRFKKGTLRQRAWIAVARFTFASFIFHELYCDGENIKPSYRVFPLAAAALGIIMAFGIAQACGLNISEDVFVPGTLIGTTAYFMTAYGTAFNAWREIVRTGGTQETWKYA